MHSHPVMCIEVLKFLDWELVYLVACPECCMGPVSGQTSSICGMWLFLCFNALFKWLSSLQHISLLSTLSLFCHFFLSSQTWINCLGAMCTHPILFCDSTYVLKLHSHVPPYHVLECNVYYFKRIARMGLVGGGIVIGVCRLSMDVCWLTQYLAHRSMIVNGSPPVSHFLYQSNFNKFGFNSLKSWLTPQPFQSLFLFPL